MGTINFFKYDLRRSKLYFLLSILIFAPIAAMMGVDSMESSLGVFSYMAFVGMICPTSLFTYEQKTDCGFDGLLPGTERDKVFGRYLVAVVFMVFELLLAIVTCAIVSQFTSLELSELGVVSMTFMAITLIFLSIAMFLYYLLGRNFNQQVRAIIIMFPCIFIWVIVNSVLTIFADSLFVNVDTGALIYKIVENKEIISALALVIGVAMYIISALISTQIVKKKDYR